MRRLLALVGLLILCAGPVTADYLFIKIDLNQVNFSATGAPNQPGGGQPGQPGAGQPGQPGGGQPGLQQKGMIGKGFGGGFAGGMMGQKGMPPMQGKGQIGGMPNPGGQMGGMPNPGGQMGAMPNPGGQLGGGNFGAAEPELSSHVVFAFIELKSPLKPLSPQNKFIYESDHVWGRHGRFPNVPIVQYRHIKQESVGTEFKKKFGKDLQDANDAARLYAAASWALGHGLTKDFHRAMAALTAADPKHYAAVNYAKVQAELKKPLTTDDPVTQDILASVRAEGFHLSLSEAGHYGMLSKMVGPQGEAVVKRRLNRFEEMYDNFFYWFALQENATLPAVPRYRLYALLMDDRQMFHSRHAWWGGQPMVADAFTPRRDNIIILSAKRLDDNFAVFEKNAQALSSLHKITRQELISGEVWNRPDAKKDLFTFASVQTLTLMQKAMEEEAERAAISHEAARQLLSATGTLPRYVNVPEWIQNGLASYFDTPYGALYGGVGLPNWTNLISFKHYLKEKNRYGATRSEALIRTISDRFFREALRAEEDAKDQPDSDKDKKDGKVDKVKEAQEVARGTSWALVYYLLQKQKLPQLMRYTQELNNLPRDLELDDRALQACFARAFDLADAKDPRRLDPGKTREFADAWFSHMLDVNLEVPEAQEVFTAIRYPVRRPAATQQLNQFNNGQPGLMAPGVNPGGAGLPMAPNLLPPGVGPK